MSSVALSAHPAAALPVTPRVRLRLTARGRAVLGVLLAAPVLATMLALGVVPATATGEAATTDLEYVTVAAGESLWQLAESLAPSADPRDVISDIVRLNGLTSWQVEAGARLAIPHAWAPRD